MIVVLLATISDQKTCNRRLLVAAIVENDVKCGTEFLISPLSVVVLTVHDNTQCRFQLRLLYALFTVATETKNKHVHF